MQGRAERKVQRAWKETHSRGLLNIWTLEDRNFLFYTT